MKNVLILFLSIFFITSLSSCLEDSCTDKSTFVRYTPVYMTKAQFRKDIKATATRTLENPGKMYFYKDFLFINEQGKGIHVYNIKDENNPTKVTFYDIPGNFDLAIKENILYADNVIDLISIDISDIEVPKLVKRIENYKNNYVEGIEMHYVYSVKSQQTIVIDCTNPNFGENMFFEGDIGFVQSLGNFPTVMTNKSSASSTGVGGSFARFSIVNDYLYVVDQTSLLSFLVDNPSCPILKNTNQIGWGIETIFPYKDKLFVGSNSGMFIFDNSSPATPVLLSSFQHARACDPVVINENTAYVTLRSGTTCQGFTNQLDVIDISNILEPKLIKSYPMSNPHGLSYDNEFIYLAEGNSGFKVLDVKDPAKVKEISSVQGLHSYDMISLPSDKLFMIGDDGFYLYNVKDPKNPVLKSSIKLNQ